MIAFIRNSELLEYHQQLQNDFGQYIPLTWIVDEEKNKMQLETIRGQIDRIDETLLRLLAERDEAVRTIGQVKNHQGIPITDRKREEYVIRRIREEARCLGLNENFVSELYGLILVNSKEIQNEI